MNKINKIINEEINKQLNELLDVYHGTDAFFHEFNLDKIGSGDGRGLGGWGIYFSDDPDVSKQYITNKSRVKKFGLKHGKFFDLDDYLSSGTGNIILNGLKSISTVSDEDILEFQEDFVNYSDDTSNKQALEWLTYVLGGEKQVSMFLRKLGYDGNMFKDKTNPEATNYVIYNTDVIKYLDDNNDDLLNETFNEFVNKIKVLIENGELREEKMNEILNSPKFSPKQKIKIKELFNQHVNNDETRDLFNYHKLKQFFNNHKLYSEKGSNEESDLNDFIQKNPSAKFAIFSGTTESPITSKSTALATAKENGYNKNKKYLFFEKENNKKIKAYIIVIV
ncbi:MAG: hypothetical protein ACOCVF_02045 [bacterium]